MTAYSETVAVVPLRSPGTGKTRLSPRLDRDQRAALTEAMFHDVVAALRRSSVDRIVVAAAGDLAEQVAVDAAVETVRDPRFDASAETGLNAALFKVTDRMISSATMVVVAADLPCLTAAEVEDLLTVEAAVVVAPTSDGGTGGLVRRPPSVIAPAYGPGSARRHTDAATAAGVPVATRRLTGFAHDVDTVTDLEALCHLDPGTRTRRVLNSLVVRSSA